MVMTILTKSREQTLDGCFELIERERYESLGMHSSIADAVGWAETHQVRRFEVWLDGEIVLTV